MKLPSLRLVRLALATLVTGLATSAYSAEPAPSPASTIYSPQKGLAAGWTQAVWGGLTNEPSKLAAKEKGGTSILITPTATATAYAGMQVSTAGPTGVKLTESLRKGGEVHLYLRNGLDLAGAPAPEQAIQVMLSFEPEGGQPVNGTYQVTALTPALPADKGTQGWQLVKLSIADQLKGRVDAATPVRLRAVYVQYSGEPTGSYFFGQCFVAQAAAK